MQKAGISIPWLTGCMWPSQTFYAARHMTWELTSRRGEKMFLLLRNVILNTVCIIQEQGVSDRFCSVSVRGVPLNHVSKAEEFLFFVFQSVNWANTVNIKAPPTHNPRVKDVKFCIRSFLEPENFSLR
jgi:hypothetical protein